MEFDPTPKDELDKMRLLPKGTYDFEVVGAEDTTSKAGNGMIALELRVFRPDGNGAVLLKDWLVASDHYLCRAKIYNFCATTGKMDDYEAGSLSALVCDGAAGKCKVGIQEDEQYGPQNKIVDYVDPAAVPKNEKKERTGYIEGVSQQPRKNANEAFAEAGGDPEIPF